MNFDVQFADMLEVHNIRHNLCMAQGGLFKDREASTAIAAAAKDRMMTISHGESPSVTSFVSMAGQFERDLHCELNRTDNIVRRLDGASDLVRSFKKVTSDGSSS